uniref:Uncharacterized protein At2g43136 n=1 Tax=Arabidopsis thaliana TaxID=3702 RepID=Q8S8J4_ARATH|nr:hypothetical protein [Arabidopsis thaliana]
MATTELKPSAVKNPKRNRRPSHGPKKDLKKKKTKITKKTKKSKAPTFDKTIEKSRSNDQKTDNDEDSIIHWCTRHNGARDIRNIWNNHTR